MKKKEMVKENLSVVYQPANKWAFIRVTNIDARELRL